MKILNDQELMSVYGGAINWGLMGLAIVGIITFGVGVLDGFKRPMPCRK